MKIATSILALLVLFLSTHCVFRHETAESGKPVAKKTCCMKSQACAEDEDEEDKKDEGCKEACNPFMACCGGAWVLPETTVTFFKAVIELPVKTGFKKDLFISNYNADCWHPPEVV